MSWIPVDYGSVQCQRFVDVGSVLLLLEKEDCSSQETVLEYRSALAQEDLLEKSSCSC